MITKSPTKPVKKAISKPLKNKAYKLFMKFNNQEFKFDTDDLSESITSVKPFNLKTKVYFHVEKDGKVCERTLFVLAAKKNVAYRYRNDGFYETPNLQIKDERGLRIYNKRGERLENDTYSIDRIKGLEHARTY